MADEIDKAQEYMETLLEANIRAARGIPADDTVIHILCIDCGTQIPPERRKAKPGCSRCIDCQEAHEFKRRGYL